MYKHIWNRHEAKFSISKARRWKGNQIFGVGKEGNGTWDLYAKCVHKARKFVKFISSFAHNKIPFSVKVESVNSSLFNKQKSTKKFEN